VPVCSYFSISFIVIASWLTQYSTELNLALDETTGGVVTNSVEETVSLNDLLRVRENVEEAMFLAKYGSSVTVLVRKDKLRASNIMADRLLGRDR
jgi:hypothetical protein